MTDGCIHAVVGPSGAGKDTLLAAARAKLPALHLVRRVITRPAAAGGEDFEGVSDAEFARRLADGAFALNWQAHGLSYGIPVAVLSHISRGYPVAFNGSRAMLGAAAAAFPGLRVIHVTASAPVLAARLAARGREDHGDIAQRLSRARLALPAGLDIVEIDNSGDLDPAVSAMVSALSSAQPPRLSPKPSPACDTTVSGRPLNPTGQP